MIIWVDNEGSIEVELCAMAPYADERDTLKMNHRLAVLRWENSLRAAYEDNVS